MVSNSNDNTNRQVANIRKAFPNHSSIDIKLSKTQLYKNDTIRRIFRKFIW